MISVENVVNTISSGGDLKALLKADLDSINSSGYEPTMVSSFPAIIHPTHVTTYMDGVEKAITLVDFKSILDEVTKGVSENIPPINLPYGCFMFSRSGDTTYLNCYYPEVIAEIKYDSRTSEKQKMETFKIPFPNVIISFVLKKVSGGLWGVHQVKYFSTPRTVTQLPDKNVIVTTNLEEGVFKMPFSNVYEDDKLCYGGNTMPSRFTDNLRGLDYYYQILTIAPFNSDLGIRGLTQNYQPKDWYKHLSTLTKFPYDLLQTRR